MRTSVEEAIWALGEEIDTFRGGHYHDDQPTLAMMLQARLALIRCAEVEHALVAACEAALEYMAGHSRDADTLLGLRLQATQLIRAAFKLAKETTADGS